MQALHKNTRTSKAYQDGVWQEGAVVVVLASFGLSPMRPRSTCFLTPTNYVLVCTWYTRYVTRLRLDRRLVSLLPVAQQATVNGVVVRTKYDFQGRSFQDIPYHIRAPLVVTYVAHSPWQNEYHLVRYGVESFVCAPINTRSR